VAGVPFDLLVDAVQEYAIFMLHPDGSIASWNRGAAGIKGYTAAEVLGRPLSTFYTAEDAEEIFGMFSRLDTEVGVPGSGIGLAIAGRVLERHGGRIWVEARPGGGSVFRFSLPPEPAA
jgi:PAS domain S-box-containing protein